MSKTTKLLGMILGISAATTMGVAMAQSVPPDADVANPAIGAGQQSVHGTPMGETGVSEVTEPRVLLVPLAAVVEPTATMGAAAEQPPVVVVQPEPQRTEPAPVIVQAEPTRQPEPVAQAPAMPEPDMRQQPRMRADRN
ncbi:hypothetical protein WG922_15325 [Ramlibacter sp. AN1015]|uniref:hypothetical protein n=1 Tax=Ramlibacter sp. AN1015 TaxID=3133428 RepID=UPI0030BC4A8B